MSHTIRRIRGSYLLAILPWATLLAWWTIFISLIDLLFRQSDAAVQLSADAGIVVIVPLALVLPIYYGFHGRGLDNRELLHQALTLPMRTRLILGAGIATALAGAGRWAFLRASAPSPVSHELTHAFLNVPPFCGSGLYADDCAIADYNAALARTVLFLLVATLSHLLSSYMRSIDKQRVAATVTGSAGRH